MSFITYLVRMDPPRRGHHLGLPRRRAADRHAAWVLRGVWVCDLCCVVVIERSSSLGVKGCGCGCVWVFGRRRSVAVLGHASEHHTCLSYHAFALHRHAHPHIHKRPSTHITHAPLTDLPASCRAMGEMGVCSLEPGRPLLRTTQEAAPVTSAWT